MKLNLRWTNLDQMLKKLDELAEVGRQIPTTQIASQVEQHALLGLNASVYDTEPGAYERTQALRNSVYSKALSGVLGFEVGATEDYASHVEYGTSVNALSEAQLLQATQGRSKPDAPLVFGRSGVRYTLPGPFILPAAMYGKTLMEKAFVTAVKRIWG